MARLLRISTDVSFGAQPLRTHSLLNVMSSTRAASEQAGAALANACANCMANQIAARHAGSMSVLVEVLARTDSENMIECCVCAIRNLCINCVEHQVPRACCLARARLPVLDVV
jgi:hypothetical protein